MPTVISIAWSQAPLMVAAYFVGAIFEEIGWTAWHVVPWWLGQGHAVAWVIGQSALTVLTRVVMVWIYSQGGQSLFASILFHAMINTSYSLFPNNGSHYNPTIALLPMALLVAVIAFRYPPRPAHKFQFK